MWRDGVRQEVFALGCIAAEIMLGRPLLAQSAASALLAVHCRTQQGPGAPGGAPAPSVLAPLKSLPSELQVCPCVLLE